MGVGLNTMLAAIGTVGVAASKVASSADQQATREKSKKNEEEAAKEKEKSRAIDEANSDAALAQTQLDAEILKKNETQNFWEQGLARSEGKMDNLMALQKAKEALSNESKANDIRMQQILKVRELKGYGGKK